MPTIKQLPTATAVSANDALPISQNGLTRNVAVGTLLNGTQPAVTLSKGKLLGRVSATAGGPEPVATGIGLTIQSGALVATGGDHSGFDLATSLSPDDEVLLNSSATPKRLAATKLRSLFSAGPGVTIDDSGLISAPSVASGIGPQGPKGDPGLTGPQGPKGDTGAQGPIGPAGAATSGPATSNGIGGVKPGAGLSVAADGTLSVADVTVAGARATGASAVRSLGDRLSEVFSLRDFGIAGYVPGAGGDDLPAFKAALARLTALGGGRLLLPAGVFNISAPITVPSPDGAVPIQLVGQGEATVIQPTAAMTSLISVTAGNLRLADFTLNNAGRLAGAGISITKPADNSRCEFDRLNFALFDRGVWVQDGDVLHFNQPRFVACGTAFSIDNGMLNSSIAEMYALGGNGIDVAVPTSLQPEGLQVIGGKILPSTAGAFGVRLRAGLEVTFAGLVVDQLAAPGANGFVIDSSGAAIRAIKLTDCWTGINAAATGTGSGIKLVGAATEQVHIDQHTFDSHGAYGLEVDGGAGLLLDLLVAHSRFKGNGLGDISLKACRAIVIGCDLRHLTASIVTAGTQVQVAGIGNRFIANPQLGTIPGGFFAGNIGNTNDSLDGQSIGVNVRAPVVAATTLDVLSAATIRGNTTLQAGLAVSSGGASIVGNTGVTGTLSVSGVLSAGNFTNGSADPEGAVTATPGSLYQRLSTSAGLTDHTLFVKEIGAGSTGWKALASQDFVARNNISILPSVPTGGLYGGSGTAGLAQQVTPSGAAVVTGGTLTVRTATVSQTGVVQPDGTTITVSATGVISAVGGGTTTPLGSAAPKMDGAAAAGLSLNAARDDHVHPTDTSRAPVAAPVFTGSMTLPSWTTAARPSNPNAGMEGFATDVGRRETFTGSTWVQYVRTTDVPAASGQLLGGSGTNGQAAAITVGAGLALVAGTLTATAMPIAPRTITTASSVTVAATDGLVVINKATGAATTVTLEAGPVPGTVHRIKDGKGDAATNPITILPASGTIDGAASTVINQNRGAITLEYNGAEWSIT